MIGQYFPNLTFLVQLVIKDGSIQVKLVVYHRIVFFLYIQTFICFMAEKIKDVKGTIAI